MVWAFSTVSWILRRVVTGGSAVISAGLIGLVRGYQVAIAPLLIEMANNLSLATRRDIKRRWVDLLCDLIAPLCDPEFDLLDQHAEPAEIQYVLRPT